jgi:alkylation response protein AidB-like acyl-CoA dehydrogenase
MAELGLLGLPLPAEFGGFGGGAVDAMGVMEAIGAALIVEPYLPTVGLARNSLRAPARRRRSSESCRRWWRAI